MKTEKAMTESQRALTWIVIRSDPWTHQEVIAVNLGSPRDQRSHGRITALSKFSRQQQTDSRGV